MTELKITQADREAAAAYYYSAGGSPKIANEIREGKKDGWFRVQAFARHRITAEEGKAELVEAAEKLRDDMLRRAKLSAMERGDDDIVVEAGTGVWLRFNDALARVRGEG